MLLKKGFEGIHSDTDEEQESMNDSDSSDVSSSDTSESENEEAEVNTRENMETESEDNDGEVSQQVEEEEEDEDEVIKAIRRENQRQRDHPPIIHCEDFITDISFHPRNDILAVASIVGDVILYKYTNENNEVLSTLELHSKACRDVEFNENGDTLFSVAKDKGIMLSNMETGKLVAFYDDAHYVPIYCVRVINENMFATGDNKFTSETIYIPFYACRR